MPQSGLSALHGVNPNKKSRFSLHHEVTNCQLDT